MNCITLECNEKILNLYTYNNNAQIVEMFNKNIEKILDAWEDRKIITIIDVRYIDELIEKAKTKQLEN